MGCIECVKMDVKGVNPDFMRGFDEVARLLSIDALAEAERSGGRRKGMWMWMLSKKKNDKSYELQMLIDTCYYEPGRCAAIELPLRRTRVLQQVYSAETCV